IAEAAGLEHAVAAEFGERSHQLLVAVDAPEGRRPEADAGEERLFRQPVLRSLERRRRRQHGHVRDKRVDGLDRHVLEFVGDDVAFARELGQRECVVIGPDDLPVGDLGCRTVAFRLQHDRSVAETSGGDCQHAPALASADAADRRPGRQRRHQPPSAGRSGTASVWRARQASSRAARSGSESASTEAASNAALMAPALPMASVPTGTPAGICTMESNESWPDNAFDSTGTPNTGSGVSAAAMPGRWAAPPAPAITTLKPRSRAPVANS